MSDAIVFKEVNQCFGDKEVLQNLNFCLEKGRIHGLVGASGCGKTTTLKLINGLLSLTSGEIVINGELFKSQNILLLRQAIGYCVQGSGLFPHMNILDNISLLGKIRGWSKQKRIERAGELLELIGLPVEEFLFKYPSQMSGGQRQRVAIARSLFLKPEIILMDEPFGALDPITKSEIHYEVIRLQKKMKFTLVLVTHDLSEAYKLCDNLILLNEGRVEQMGSPSDFLLSPSTSYVESFIRSYSPASQLKEMSLYGLVDKKIICAFDSSNGLVWNYLSQPEDKKKSKDWLSSLVELKKKEVPLVHISANKEILNFLYLKEDQWQEDSEPLVVSADESLLSGIQRLVRSQGRPLLVLSEKGDVVGVFNQKVLDGIS